MTKLKLALQFLLFVFAYSVVGTEAQADDRMDAITLVREAGTTLSNFKLDPNMQWFRENIGQAKAVVIVPQLVKAGFIFGASGGNGIVMAKDSVTDSWSSPTIYSVGSVTWGLQAGGELAEVVMLVMTESGMRALLSTKLQLGGDVSVAAGPVGAGTQAATVDILQFSRTMGVYGGLTLEGAVITPRDELTNALYGKVVDPLNILVRHQSPPNPEAAKLREILFKITSNKRLTP